MKKIILLVGAVLMLLCISCKKDENEPEKVLLRTKKWYASKEESIPRITYKFEYDSDDRLFRINSYHKETNDMFGYCIYRYNTEGNLEESRDYSYANDVLGWVLSDSTIYKYENRLLIFSQTHYPPPISYAVSYHYEYEGSSLKKESRFDNNELLYIILYDYSNGLCTKETRFVDSGLKNISDYRIHHYEGGLRIRSDVYNSQNQVIQIITHEYDLNGNLILEVSEKTDFTVVAPLDYMYRYEYN
ncbi:MAG: hypothetical protein AB7S72_09720 [Draconibacterium sp.]